VKSEANQLRKCNQIGIYKMARVGGGMQQLCVNKWGAAGTTLVTARILLY